MTSERVVSRCWPSIRVVLGELAGHDRLGNQDEEAHEVVAGAARLLQLGEVVPVLLPLGLVPAVVALEDGNDVLIGRVEDGPEGQVARFHAGVSLSGL